MSSFAIEKALWQATSNPADAQALRADPAQYLSHFRLDDDERALILAWDVQALCARGVSPMVLMMAFNAAGAGSDMMDYIRRINGMPPGAMPG